MYKPGQCGNPNGRPKGTPNKFSLKEFQNILSSVEKEKKKSLIRHAIERAYEDDKVLCVILNKILPDVKYTEDHENNDWIKEEITIDHDVDDDNRLSKYIQN